MKLRKMVRLHVIPILFLFPLTSNSSTSITGKIDIIGSLYALDSENTVLTDVTTATKIDFDMFGNDSFISTYGDGSFDGLAYQIGTITDFQFSPLSNQIDDFLTIGDYSFQLTTAFREQTNNVENYISLSGTGIFHGPGHIQKEATWSLSANGSNSPFAWSATFEVIDPEVVYIDIDQNGQNLLTIQSQIDGVPPFAEIEIINVTQNIKVDTTANSAGFFTSSISGQFGNEIKLKISDSNDTYYSQSYYAGAIEIIDPDNFSVLSNDYTNVEGRYINSSNRGVTINGLNACTYNGSFYINNLPLDYGANPILASYTDINGINQNNAITVINLGNSRNHLFADSYCGIAPFNVNFDIEFDSYISHIEIDYDGDGTIDLTDNSYTPRSLQHTYTQAGVYSVTAWIYTLDGNAHEFNLYIVAKDISQQEDVLTQVWLDMWQALKTDNKELAILHISPDSRQVYEGIFEALMPHMNDIYDELSDIKHTDINIDSAQSVLIRDEDGTLKTYIINYKINEDGVWRIDSF